MNQRDDSFYASDEDGSEDNYESETEFDSRHLRQKRTSSTSTGTKVVLIVLGIFGVLLLLCCGGVFWVVNKFKEPRATTDPTEIREITRSMLDVKIPERFEPAQAVTMDLVLMKMDTAGYEARDGETTLTLMRMDVPVQDGQLNEAKKSMQAQSSSQTQLDNFQSESKTYTVNGQEISVIYYHGMQSQMYGVPHKQSKLNGNPAEDTKPDDVPAEGVPADDSQQNGVPEEVEGSKWFSSQIYLNNDKQMIMIMISGPEEEFDLEEIEAMIQTIRLSN